MCACTDQTAPEQIGPPPFFFTAVKIGTVLRLSGQHSAVARADRFRLHAGYTLATR